MNDLVDDVNSKIKAVCDANPQCIFIDAMASINRLEGHFCEPGVDESYDWARFFGHAADRFVTRGSTRHFLLTSSREETWFYEW
jgi:hypothetical protein